MPKRERDISRDRSLKVTGVAGGTSSGVGRRKGGGGDDDDFAGGLAAPRASGARGRASGRLKSLARPFRALDADARRVLLLARLEALESDGAPDGGAGALDGDDGEFYVNDEETERKSRGRVGNGNAGGGTTAPSPAAAAAARAFADKRAGIRSLGELVAAELGLLGAAQDAASGTVDFARLRTLVAAGGGARGVPARAYVLTSAAPSRYPGRPHCSVCGFRSAHACTRCGARFCSVACNTQHKETRCLAAGSSG